MNCTPEWINYSSTNAFSDLAINYLHEHPSLRPFYTFSPDLNGIAQSIESRKKFNTDRSTLVEVLNAQYVGLPPSEKVDSNIEKLALANTFTVCTAHQPNLFTGYLYFIYKIVHAIKLAEELNQAFPQNYFVPVYYMGSEDNDLEELNHIFLGTEKLTWNTAQTGSVGRMNTKGLDVLVDRIAGELGVWKYGQQLIDLLKSSYVQSGSVQEATLKFVHQLFESYGLVVLIADNVSLKRTMTGVFEDDLFIHKPAAIVQQTARQLSSHYHVQVNPREINLFYLIDGIRERIVKNESTFQINNSNITFTPEAMSAELQRYPERFSPNVVLRGLYQETILPNIAFIGGGSEIAYWLELQELFQHYNVPFPVLLLRNSFLIVDPNTQKHITKLKLSSTDLFKDESALLTAIVQNESSRQLTLEKELQQLSGFYHHLESVAGQIDPTLIHHVRALETRATQRISNLEKKMLRAEKRKFSEQSSQLRHIKSALFPRQTLQERVENVLPYFARYGYSFIQMLYEHSPTFQKKFGVLFPGDQSR